MKELKYCLKFESYSSSWFKSGADNMTDCYGEPSDLDWENGLYYNLSLKYTPRVQRLLVYWKDDFRLSLRGSERIMAS